MAHKLNNVQYYSVNDLALYSDGKPFVVAQTGLVLGPTVVTGIDPATLFVDSLETLTQEIIIMAFVPSDVTVVLKDQLDDAAAQGISVQEVDVDALDKASVYVSVAPDTKLGSLKLEITSQSGVSSFENKLFTIPNALRVELQEPRANGQPDGSGILPYTPGQSGSFSLEGYGFYHAQNAIYGAAGLAAHQPGLTGMSEGWRAGSAPSGNFDIAAGAEIPMLVDLLNADDSISDIEIGAVSIAGREQADRKAASVAFSIPDTDAFNDYLLPEGKKPYKVKARAWNGLNGLRETVGQDSGGDDVIFEVAMNAINTITTQTLTPTGGAAGTFAAAVLTAGSSTGTIDVAATTSTGKACFGSALNHSITVTHDIYPSEAFTMSNLQLAADGKSLSMDFAIPSSRPIGNYNVKLFGDQNADAGIDLGQVNVGAAPLDVTGSTIVITACTPAGFDAGENGLQEMGQKASYQLDIASGLPDVASEGTVLYLKVSKGGFVIPDSCISSVVMVDDNTVTFDLDLRQSADPLSGAALNWDTHLGVFELELELYDREETSAAGTDALYGIPDGGATKLSSGTHEDFLITAEAPAALPKAQVTMTDGNPAEYDGVRSPEAERWVQCGVYSGGAASLGPAHTMKWLGINMAASDQAPGHDHSPAADLLTPEVEILDSGGNNVAVTALGDMIAPLGTGNGLFLITSSFVTADAEDYGTSPSREQRGRKTELVLEIQAAPELGQGADPAVGVSSSLDAAGETVEGSRYEIRIGTRACDGDGEKLVFSGESSFYTFPSAVQAATVVNALLQIDENANEHEVISIINARGMYLTENPTQFHLYNIMSTNIEWAGASGSISFDSSSAPTVIDDDGSAWSCTAFHSQGGHFGVRLESAGGPGKFTKDDGSQLSDVVGMLITKAGGTDADLVNGMNSMADMTGIDVSQVVHSDPDGGPLEFSANPQAHHLDGVRIVLVRSGNLV